MSTFSEETLLKRKQLALKKRQLEMIAAFGLKYYKPHKKQHWFAEHADFKFRLAQCGNRFGKSQMGISEDLAFCLGERPWYEKDDPRRYIGIPKRSVKGLVIASTWKKVEEVFTGEGKRGVTGKIWNLLPKNVIVGKPKRQSDGTICQMSIKGLYGVSTLVFYTRQSFKSNPQSAESSDWDFIHVDEPVEEALWTAVSRGLVDRNGKAWFTCTLLEQPWIVDFFYPTMAESKLDSYEQLRDGRKIKWSFTGSMYDNPYLTRDAIEDFLEELSDEEKECRITGRPAFLSGLVFKEFEREKHVLDDVPFGWKNFADPPKDYSIYVRIDPHPRTPHAVMFFAVSPLGHIFVYDEIFKATDFKELAELILAKTAGRNVINIKADPVAWIPDPESKITWVDQLAKHGLYGVTKGSKDLAGGIPVVKTYLKASKPQRVWFTPIVRTTLWEINRYQWANRQGIPLNVPVDKDDHMMENLRRGLVDDLRYVDYEIYGKIYEDEPITADYSCNNL